MRVLTMVFVAVLVAPALGEAQIAIRPGQYEFTLEMNLGIPAAGQQAVLDAAGFDKQKKLDCIAQEVKGAQDIADWFAREAQGEDAPNCKMSDVKASGNKMTFITTCAEDDVRMTMSTEMTFGADSFTTVTKGKDPEGRMTTSKMSAKRVGECKP